MHNNSNSNWDSTIQIPKIIVKLITWEREPQAWRNCLRIYIIWINKLKKGSDWISRLSIKVNIVNGMNRQGLFFFNILLLQTDSTDMISIKILISWKMIPDRCVRVHYSTSNRN